MYYQPAQQLKLYRNFKSLRVNDFHSIVRYYEEFEEAMRALNFDEYFDCTYAYTAALFETGDYGKHVVMCDHLLEIIIMENVESWAGEDVYAQVLFKKAASLCRLREDAQAEHVLRELLKLHPEDPLSRRLLQVCLLRRRPRWLLQTRAIAIVLLLLGAVAVAVALFVVEPFFSPYAQAARWIYNALMLGGAGLLAAGEFAHYWRSSSRVRGFAKKMRRRKAVHF